MWDFGATCQTMKIQYNQFCHIFQKGNRILMQELKTLARLQEIKDFFL